MSDQNHIIIAIDGPAGAGKSTVAKMVASRLSLLYIDSGAMYRAVAWKALSEKVDISNERRVAELAKRMRIQLEPANEGTRVFADGKEITHLIRTPEVTDASSKIATIAAVREVLVSRQQQMGRTRGVVMEGRDIGTVVFPGTPFKFYLDASSNERARRRKRDLECAGHSVRLQELEREVIARDRRDMSRAVGPLRKVEGAFAIDTTDMSIEQVVQAIVERVEAIRKEAVKG
ncbi:MAG: (d)CMP kinase [Candidatus Lindowbacteria bacterium]|nr:(d)CMP kinase [Candidatus Lindowbacteria bacterium]